jgi:non-heme chloroperoxidase
MPTFLATDGAELFYKDWGAGQPVVFSHGWPLSADAWDAQMLFLGERGCRVVAHDRRGHGRSEQTWNGNDVDTYADDLATLLDELELENVVLVGHSTGGGEVARYVGRYGTKRLSRLVLLGAVPPFMMRTPDNPEGVPPAVFEEIRARTTSDRSTYFRELAVPFFGFNQPGVKVQPGLIHTFWLQGVQAGFKSVVDCIRAFSETDFREDLKKIDVPTLIVHGDADQIVPIDVAARRTAKLVRGATLKVYPGAPHGLALTRADEFNRDLIDFISAGVSARRPPEAPAPLMH